MYTPKGDTDGQIYSEQDTCPFAPCGTGDRFSMCAYASKSCAGVAVCTGYFQGRQNEVLGRAIVQLFNEDQALLADLERAKQNPAFRQTLKSYVDRSKVKDHNPNFYDSVVYALWAQTPDAPEIVRCYAKFRKSTDARVQSIVADNGWPQRAAVGDEAAADFFFVFGHAMATTSGE